MIDSVEDAAYAELQCRKRRVTNLVGVSCVLVGLAVTGAVFWALLELQFRYLGGAELSITVGVASIVGVGGCVMGGFKIQRLILRLRAPSWINELSANHRSRREQMEVIASLWQ